MRALHQPAELPSAAGNARATLVARLRERIETHLRNGWSVARYAKALNVTPARLRAACLEITGKTPTRVLEERLLLEAKRNLTYTNMTSRRPPTTWASPTRPTSPVFSASWPANPPQPSANAPSPNTKLRRDPPVTRESPLGAY